MSELLALSNKRVQRLRRLVNRRDERREQGVFVVEGHTLLSEAVRAGWEIETQFVGPDGRAVQSDGEIVHVAPGVLEKVASTENPQPVIGIVKQRRFGEEVVGSADFVVVADGVSDPGNLGTMMRSAAGAGADAFIITPGTVDHTNPKVVRASAGSLFRLPVVESAIGPFTAGRFVSIGTTSHGASVYTEVDFTRRIALVFGNESGGLSGDTGVQEWATIPMAGEVESLNVAMACAVMCFEVARQRRAGSGTLEES